MGAKLTEEHQKAHESEREFMDVFRSILVSGYVLDQDGFFELIETLKISHQIASLQ